MEAKNDSGNDLRTTCVSFSQEPDVEIIVGGKKFMEYSQALCSWSGFFDKALHNGMMKESITKKIEFPDKDPQEWQLIVSLASPFSKDRLTQYNVRIALPWFDHLDCRRAMERCDELLCPQNVDKWEKKQLTAQEFTTGLFSILKVLPIGLQYNLPATKQKCFIILKSALGHYHDLFVPDEVASIVELVRSHDECKRALWLSLKKHLPPSIIETKDNADLDMDKLVSNDLFPDLLYSNMTRIGQPELKRKVDKIAAIIDKAAQEECTYSREQMRNTGKRLRKKIKADKECGDLFTKFGVWHKI